MRLQRPKKIDKNHPISTQEYAVYTPPINDLIGTICGWVNRMETGGYIYGPSRYGKSRGVKWFLREGLEERFGFQIPIVYWVREEGSSDTKRSFWLSLLLASEFTFADPEKPSRTAISLRNLFVARLKTLAKSAGFNYIVLVIDEAQVMTLAEWQLLLGVQNNLDLDGIRLSVFSVGTQQIGYQYDFLAKTGNSHIASRFLVLHYRFRGVSGVCELEYILNGYDLESEWPKNSGKTYLKYFSSECFSSGRRLSQCAERMWKIFVDLTPLHTKRMFSSGSMELEVPMKHIAMTAEEILWRVAEGEDWGEVTATGSLTNIINETRYADHMNAISHLM